MEKPTYTAIDYNSLENKVIEERIRNYYLPVKNTFEAGKRRGVLGKDRTKVLINSIP